jgi:uncharacterized heparinase superfamily protein
MAGPRTFTFLNETHDLGAASDWNHPHRDKLWLYNLHYFDDLNAEGTEGRAAWHAALMERWMAENPPAAGNGWEPYPLSLRIVNWIKWAARGNEPTAGMLHSLAVQARFLSRRLEYHLLGNHLMANAKALVFAGLFFRGHEAESWLKTGLHILQKQLPEQVLPDGGHFERSPMYHSIILEDLLDLINLWGVYAGRDGSPSDPNLGDPAPQWIQAARRMLSWLGTMTHPDGEIALFNDAALGIAPRPAWLEAYAARLGIEGPEPPAVGVTHLAATGYIRAEAGHAVAFLDVGPCGPDYLLGHAHADTLSFELSVHGQRVVVDSGTSCYGSGAERQRQRSTAAHNTVVVDSADSSEVWGGFRVARRARPLDLELLAGWKTITAACSHDGYGRLPGRPVHRREWRLDESSLRVADRVDGGFSRATARFQFHPDVRVQPSDNGRSGLLTLPSGRTVRWRLEEGEPIIGPATYHPRFGTSLASTCLTVECRQGRSVVVFTWS